jgi:rhomboid protease GluP
MHFFTRETSGPSLPLPAAMRPATAGPSGPYMLEGTAVAPSARARSTVRVRCCQLSLAAPVTSTLTLLAAMGLCICTVFPSWRAALILNPPTVEGATSAVDSLPAPRFYFRLFTYPFVHANWSQFSEQYMWILLLGPAIENRVGGRLLAFSVLLSNIVSGIVHVLAFDSVKEGSCGIVALFFVLSAGAFVRFDRRLNVWEIPLTVVLLVVGFCAHQHLDSRQDQLGHLIGLAVGVMWVLLSTRLSANAHAPNSPKHGPYVYDGDYNA